jgi:DNA-directed RNA polymerase specialized sigma24 family protein
LSAQDSDSTNNADLLVAHESTPRTCLDRKIKQERVREEIAFLPDDVRPVLELYILEDKQVKEIAVELGRPRNTIYEQRARGLRLLTEALKDLV